jgi:hypothetical protein
MKLIIAALLFFSASSSFALIDVEAVGGISIANQKSDVVGPTLTSKNFNTYGALTNFRLPMMSIGIMTGALYTELGSHAENGVSKVDEKVPYIQIPFALDLWFHNILAIGIGGYYGIPAGNVVDSNATGIYTNQSISFAQANYATKDYGAIAHMALKAHVLPLVFLSLEGQYQIGLANMTTLANQTVKNSTILAMAGIGIGF